LLTISYIALSPRAGMAVVSASMDGIALTLPSFMGGAASVVWHKGNGNVYVSTNGSYLVELRVSDLKILRDKDLKAGQAHQLTSDGNFIYVHVTGNKHKILKIRTSDLAVVNSTPSLNGSGSPEGFLFLKGSMFVAIGGPPGKIVKVNPKDMTVLHTWNLPNGIENHGFTTDGTNLFVLGVSKRNVAKDKYFKLSPSLKLLKTITFPYVGSLGGNVYFPPNGSIYTSGGKLARLNPQTMAIIRSKSPGEHWLTADRNWIYCINYNGYIRVVNPKTLAVVFSKNTGSKNLHYGIVQNGYLWVAPEVGHTYGVVGWYKLYPAP
ncbi:MAG TPA: hypothetical protein VHT73_16340, partial [Thermodesulfobacteriota bacterium]|nr:hypothetical protein [Thermodesulfobacteriota bacterium]